MGSLRSWKSQAEGLNRYTREFAPPQRTSARTEPGLSAAAGPTTPMTSPKELAATRHNRARERLGPAEPRNEFLALDIGRVDAFSKPILANRREDPDRLASAVRADAETFL
jgi:hypothetical protein